MCSCHHRHRHEGDRQWNWQTVQLPWRLSAHYHYTCCMSRSEHTWAQRCGTAHCTSVTHTHTHTHTHGQTHKLHMLYEPQWTHLSPMMWNGTLHFCYTHTHTARLTNYTFCMSRSEHTWARWCGTAHTRPDSQTTHVVWAAVNTPLLLLLPYFLY